MNARLRSRLFALVVATGMALPLCAIAADSLHKKVHLGGPTTVAGKTLPAGDYDLIVEGNSAKFQSKGKVVAEVPCTWKALPAKAEHDEVLIDKGALTELEFQGNNQAIDF